MELAFPDGYRIPPHFHPTDEIVEVKKGTFLVGMGDTLDVAKAKTMQVIVDGDRQGFAPIHRAAPACPQADTHAA